MPDLYFRVLLCSVCTLALSYIRAPTSSYLN